MARKVKPLQQYFHMVPLVFSAFYNENEIEKFFVKLGLWSPLAVKWLKTPRDARC